jgi:flagellar hook-associated protein 2
MGGNFSVGGLISGIDSNALISQLMQLERQPINRITTRIQNLEAERDAVRGIRTTMQTLRNRLQDFRLTSLFDQFQSTSSEPTVASSQVSGSNPVTGSFEINVTRLATATNAASSAPLGAAINAASSLQTSGLATEVEAGTFSVNGVQFTVDPTTDTLSGILGQINASAAGVTATYDSVTDKVTFENTAASDTALINFGAGDDTSNLLNVLQVRQATQATGVGGSTTVSSTRNLGAVDPNESLTTVSLRNGAVTAGSFSINGVSISVDPLEDSILDIMGRINSSDAQVAASYDSATDTLRFTSSTLGSRTIRFGGTSDTSNFLSSVNLDTAVQTAGADSEFAINGGPAQTRNSNEVADAIGGVTIDLLSVGTTTINVSTDDEAIVEDVQAFITAYNESLTQLRELTRNEGDLRGDTGLRSIENFLRNNIFGQVPGFGDFQSLLDIGISTGKDFDATAVTQLQLDTEKFGEALREDRVNIRNLFSNNGGTGVADTLFGFVDSATGINGFLNNRSKANGTIDTQIRNLNDQTDRIEQRLLQKEERLRRQFLRLETLSSGFQSQSAALSGLGSSLRRF